MAELELTDVFVEMADTLVDDFDLIDFLHVLTERCVDLIDVSACGLLLTDGQGDLRMVAASSERTRLLELFQLQTEQGPCVDCFHTGKPVSVADLPHAEPVRCPPGPARRQQAAHGSGPGRRGDHRAVAATGHPPP
jgi:GAF domain-containing protein